MKKRILCLTFLLLLLMIPATWLNLQTGLYVSETFLPRTSTGYGPLTMVQQDDGIQFTGTLDDFSWAALVQLDAGRASVTLADGTVIKGQWDGEHLCDDSGMPYAYTIGTITVAVNHEATPPAPAYQADALCRMALGQTESRGSLLCVLVGVVVYGLGALAILFPDAVFFFGRRWLFTQAEPSDTGRALQRLGGVIGLVAATFLMYLPLFTGLLA